MYFLNLFLDNLYPINCTPCGWFSKTMTHLCEFFQCVFLPFSIFMFNIQIFGFGHCWGQTTGLAHKQMWLCSFASLNAFKLPPSHKPSALVDIFPLVEEIFSVCWEQPLSVVLSCSARAVTSSQVWHYTAIMLQDEVQKIWELYPGLFKHHYKFEISWPEESHWRD